jgi:hypothetical protein
MMPRTMPLMLAMEVSCLMGLRVRPPIEHHGGRMRDDRGHGTVRSSSGMTAALTTR